MPEQPNSPTDTDLFSLFHQQTLRLNQLKGSPTQQPQWSRVMGSYLLNLHHLQNLSLPHDESPEYEAEQAQVHGGYLKFCQFLNNMKWHDEAAAIAHQGLLRFPNDESLLAMLSQSLYSWAEALLVRNMFPEAISVLEGLLELNLEHEGIPDRIEKFFERWAMWVEDNGFPEFASAIRDEYEHFSIGSVARLEALQQHYKNLKDNPSKPQKREAKKPAPPRSPSASNEEQEEHLESEQESTFKQQEKVTPIAPSRPKSPSRNLNLQEEASKPQVKAPSLSSDLKVPTIKSPSLMESSEDEVIVVSEEELPEESLDYQDPSLLLSGEFDDIIIDDGDLEAYHDDEESLEEDIEEPSSELLENSHSDLDDDFSDEVPSFEAKDNNMFAGTASNEYQEDTEFKLSEDSDFDELFEEKSEKQSSPVEATLQENQLLDGEFPEISLEELIELIEEEPEDQEYLDELKLRYTNLKHELPQVFRSILKKNKDNPQNILNLARAYVEAGSYPLAQVQYLKYLKQVDEAEPEIHRELANVYKLMGKEKLAQKTLKEAELL